MDADKKAFLKALTKSLGRVTEAAENLKMSRQTHYNWMNTDEEYKQAVESIADQALDFVESKLFDLIDGAQHQVMTEAGPIMVKDTPHRTACIFYLKTKGKKRGYIERNEITGDNGSPIQIIIPPSV
jgi:hypothetical protein